MTDQEKLKQFITFLVESGLPKERVTFWLTKLDKGDFTAEDEQAFQQEIDTHLKVLDQIIEEAEEGLAETDENLAKNDEELVPYLQKIAEAQPKIYEAEVQNLKAELSEAEKEAMSKTEKARSGDQSKEIESIRKMLGNE